MDRGRWGGVVAPLQDALSILIIGPIEFVLVRHRSSPAKTAFSQDLEMGERSDHRGGLRAVRSGIASFLALWALGLATGWYDLWAPLTLAFLA